jgi:hypothetical protein
MFETAGTRRGALFVYWHDDENWPRAPQYKSLADWATRVAKAQAKLAKAPARNQPFELGKLKFETIGRAPPLAKLPVGAVLRVMYHRDWHVVFLKRTPTDWIWSGGDTVSEALDELDDELRKKESDYACNEDYVRADLRKLDATQRKTLARAATDLIAAS